MGSDFSREGRGTTEESRNTQEFVLHQWPSMSESWEKFQNHRINNDPENGLKLSGIGDKKDDIIIPETVLELILSLVRPGDILSCNLVCRTWKDIIIRKSYWKKWFDLRKFDWNMIPNHVKEKPEGWIVLYAQIQNEICTKNLILNHSGQAGFDDWSRYRDGGDGWRVENPPVGCDPLPEDPFFGNINAAFVTSFHWCSKWVMVDLWSLGLTPPIMKTSLPFELVCSQLYTVRWDCGGVFTWTLKVLDSNQQSIMEHESKYELPPQSEWKRAEYAFRFKEEFADKMDQVRYLVFVHDGKDSQFWKGHFGTKFARSCIKFRLCNREDMEEGNAS